MISFKLSGVCLEYSKRSKLFAFPEIPGNCITCAIAEVVDGTYDVTDAFFAQSSSLLTAQDVAEKRAFAHNHARVAGVSGTTEVNALGVLKLLESIRAISEKKRIKF